MDETNELTRIVLGPVLPHQRLLNSLSTQALVRVIHTCSVFCVKYKAPDPLRDNVTGYDKLVVMILLPLM